MSNRTVELKVLPGQPLDETGKICIHLAVLDPNGPYTEHNVLLQVMDEAGNPVKGKFYFGPARARIACNPRLNPTPRVRNGVTLVTMRTNDPRAATCPKCLATDDYTKIMEQLERSPQSNVQPAVQPVQQPNFAKPEGIESCQ
jgi:hypothetical protein